ncbi:hypothetical protein CLOM_g17757 [Closterium sp. NIES-68]|nr:hypothetical protein CLOM_g17757 [Closterium sp. NIES-68]GJP62052.1 hypothetical protein CLOP_g19153 [Closterium sp. NIES-67]GJP69636.1 hypothetical protein CLOP_g624 [Closterium sp. NIES-67]
MPFRKKQISPPSTSGGLAGDAISRGVANDSNDESAAPRESFDLVAAADSWQVVAPTTNAAAAGPGNADSVASGGGPGSVGATESGEWRAGSGEGSAVIHAGAGGFGSPGAGNSGSWRVDPGNGHGRTASAGVDGGALCGEERGERDGSMRGNLTGLNAEGGKQTLEIMLEDGLHMTVEVDSGERLLNELGYKQELRRHLSFFEVFSIGLSIVTFYAGTVPYYSMTYLNGGPVALVWYWWITVFFTHLVALSFAEISSAFPISGSLYFWAAALAGPKHGPFAAWITGWLEFLGISVCIGSLSFGGVQLLQYTIYAATGGVKSGYLLSNYECFGITVAAIVLCGLLNLLPVHSIGRIAAFSAVWQILVVLAMIVILPCVATTLQPASFVFGHFHVQLDMTHVPTDAYAFVLAMQLSIFGLYAYDTVAHMAEETKRADVTVPAAMVSCLSAASVVGWAVIVVLTACISNKETLLIEDNDTGGQQPVVQIIWEVFFSRYGNGTGAVVLLCLMYFSFFFATFAAVIGASRAAFSLSRDSGLPFSFLWRRVNRDRTPVYAVLLTCTIAILFCLPLLHSTTTFFAITSLATVAWVGSYAVPIFLRLLQPEGAFKPGAFSLQRYVGHAGRRSINAGALLFVLYTMATSMVPMYFPVTVSNFNWSSCVLLVTVAFFISWWVLDARHWFVGPYHNRAGNQPHTLSGAAKWFE